MDTKTQILDIAMNLNRIGNWAADGYKDRQSRIRMFLAQTSEYIKRLKTKKLPPKFKATFERFLHEYQALEKQGNQGPKDDLEWAEKMMTWGNILTHRAQLIS